MADFYLDTSVVTAGEYQAWAASPTWGALSTDKPLPQDGTGLGSSGATAVVAIAEIQITVLPADGNTLTIAGAVVTAKTTAAAKNQWTISGSIATCVSNLVTMLNTSGTGTAQCDAAVSTSACRLALALPFWQFARIKPGATDTLQIATRFAGSDLNYSGGANAYMLITTSGWGTPPTITQFAGGANGPYAYLLNTNSHGTIFGKTARLYGVLPATAPGPSNPGVSDVVWCRTKRSGSDIAVTDSQTGAVPAYWYAVGRILVFDDGTKWSGDGGTFTLSIAFGSGGSTVSGGIGPASGVNDAVLKFIGAKSDRSSFKLQYVSGQTSTALNAYVGVTSHQGLRWSFTVENATVQWAAGASSQNMSLVLGSTYTGTSYEYVYRNVLFDWTGSSYQLGLLTTSTAQLNLTISGCVFAIKGLSGAYSLNALGTNASSLGNTSAIFRFNNNRVYDAGGGGYKMSQLLGAGAGAALYSTIEVIDNEGVEDASPGFTYVVGNQQSCVFLRPDAARSHRAATPFVVTDWDATASPAFPTRNSVGPNGVTYSERVTTTTNATAQRPIQAFRSQKQYTAAAATKTITVELLTRTTDAWKKGELFIDVRYINTSSQVIQESSKEAEWLKHSGTPTDLDAGSGGWTGTPSGYATTKLALTTSQQIKQNTEVMVTVCFQRSVAATFYVEPEFVIS